MYHRYTLHFVLFCIVILCTFEQAATGIHTLKYPKLIVEDFFQPPLSPEMDIINVFFLSQKNNS